MKETTKTTTFKSVNPSNGQLNKEFEELTSAALDRKLEAAANAYSTWKDESFEARAGVLSKLASIMLERKEELARLEAEEMGKPLAQGIEEVTLSAGIFDYYAQHGQSLLADDSIETETGEAFISYEPIGTILSIQPWNFPYYQIARSAAPNVLAGNTVVLKHAEIVPQIAQLMEDLFKEAGAPDGVYTNLFLHVDHIEDVIADERIQAITLTGSERAGSSVAALAGKHIKKTVIELGGSDPFIVLEDANVDDAVERAVLGRIANAGQVCTSPKRIIVVEAIADIFIEKAKETFRNIKVGNPLESGTDMGPMSSKKALETVIEQVQKAAEQGANIVIGGHKIEGSGEFMEPTFITDITPDMDAYHEEIFGPVFMLYVVKNEDEAIKLANDTKYGLGATVFSSDKAHAVKVARKIESGIVYINHETSNAPQLPFGGVKKSGYGREQGKLGIYEFVNAKLIRVTEPSNPY
ncbi:NAD-dependent succinate-semialdehyde dehydrogenase [Olivibacter sitiensis]|uniref:NAD-dependent succinate-semialdehyde dehydrogenase n=1 Tax=Olivibacter sitiensis TaxID=376470 RepID=UPI00041034F8|nr:NAD-dependent succinate-semialdehyde dehydrogenase [Olivibacter sitiensis]